MPFWLEDDFQTDVLNDIDLICEPFLIIQVSWVL
jgi:hypothetical protein